MQLHLPPSLRDRGKVSEVIKVRHRYIRGFKAAKWNKKIPINKQICCLRQSFTWIREAKNKEVVNMRHLLTLCLHICCYSNFKINIKLNSHVPYTLNMLVLVSKLLFFLYIFSLLLGPLAVVLFFRIVHHFILWELLKRKVLHISLPTVISSLAKRKTVDSENTFVSSTPVS